MINDLPRSVLIMAGGTGGHVFPALATADCLRARGINVEWLGTARGIEARVVPAAGIHLHYLPVSGLRGKNLINVIKGVWNLGLALFEALNIVRRLKPVCVLGMGGFAAGPGGVAAWLLRKPLVIHEQNAVPGTTNKLLAPLATKVLQGFPVDLGGEKSCHIGNPVRGEIVRLQAPQERGVGSSGNLRLLVIGGSLGAKPINEILPATLATMEPQQRPLVKHQTGELHVDSVKQLYAQTGVEAEVLPFIADMASAYAWADLVLCRAGALTVAELSVVGVPSILVPLPYAIDDHQTANARWLADNGAGILLIQSEMNSRSLVALLERFDKNRDELLVMADKARKLSKPDAAQEVARVCLEVADG